MIIHLERLLRCEIVKIWKIHWKLKYSESQYCFADISATEAQIFMKFLFIVCTTCNDRMCGSPAKRWFIVKFEKVPFANSSKSLWCQMKRQSISIIAIVAIVSIAIVSVAIIPIAVGGSGGCWLCSCRPGGSCPSRGARALPTCDQVLDPGQVVLDSSVDPRRGRGAPHAIAHHTNQCVFTWDLFRVNQRRSAKSK